MREHIEWINIKQDTRYETTVFMYNYMFFRRIIGPVAIVRFLFISRILLGLNKCASVRTCS